jgi:uncharacterized protein
MWEGFTGDSLYLDSNIFILAIERGNPWAEMLRSLFVAIDERAILVCTSELTIAEVLSKPLQVGAQDLIGKYDQLFAPESPIKTIPIDRSILRSAAELQGRLRVKLMDSIHLATAKSHGCDFFLTEDDRLGRVIEKQPERLSLSGVAEANR